MALSPRENDVLAMLADGLTDREIAEALTISPRTVETHVSNILGKLHLASEALHAMKAINEPIPLSVIQESVDPSHLREYMKTVGK